MLWFGAAGEYIAHPNRQIKKQFLSFTDRVKQNPTLINSHIIKFFKQEHQGAWNMESRKQSNLYLVHDGFNLWQDKRKGFKSQTAIECWWIKLSKRANSKFMACVSLLQLFKGLRANRPSCLPASAPSSVNSAHTNRRWCPFPSQHLFKKSKHANANNYSCIHHV
jgi:hypothetical protein